MRILLVCVRPFGFPCIGSLVGIAGHLVLVLAMEPQKRSQTVLPKTLIGADVTGLIEFELFKRDFTKRGLRFLRLAVWWLLGGSCCGQSKKPKPLG